MGEAYLHWRLALEACYVQRGMMETRFGRAQMRANTRKRALDWTVQTKARSGYVKNTR